jgi:hypothetical protein
MKFPESLDLSPYHKVPLRWTDVAFFKASREEFVVENSAEMRAALNLPSSVASEAQLAILTEVLKRAFHAGYIMDRLILPNSSIPITMQPSANMKRGELGRTRPFFNHKGEILELGEHHEVDPEQDTIEKIEIEINVLSLLPSIKKFQRMPVVQEHPDPNKVVAKLVGPSAEATIVHEEAHAANFLRMIRSEKDWLRFVSDRKNIVKALCDDNLSEKEQSWFYLAALSERKARLWERTFISHYYPGSNEDLRQHKTKESDSHLVYELLGLTSRD